MRSTARSILSALLLLASLLLPSQGLAQKDSDGNEITKLSLLANTGAVEPGKPFYLGVHFKILDPWHLYWRFPGSAGYPPTVTAWELPPGWTTEPMEFPLPEKVIDPNQQTLFAYEHEVLLPVKVTPPEKLGAGPFTLGVKLKWQVCAETCIPGEGEVAITLPAGPANPANEAIFSKWLAQLPQTGEPPVSDVKFSFADKKLTVRIEGLPAAANVEFFPIPPPRYRGILEFGQNITIEKAPDGTVTAEYPFDSDIDWSGLLVLTDAAGNRKGWYIGDPPPVEDERRAGAEDAVADDGETWDPFDDIVAQKDTGFWSLILLGLLGGLLLNLMPCVLPVISIKIFGFVQQADQSRQQIFKLGLAFCAGVFAFFLVLAVLVLGLAAFGESLGWGAHFSNPIVLTLLIAAMFVFSLSLLGVFEFELPGGASSKLSELSAKKGAGGAFLHGFLTTLLGTSCTAPLVAPVFGVALNQPGPVIFALFLAIATGLALPYFLLTWQPAWMRFLPKPGTWMIRFKQVLGFVMLAFAIWFLRSFPTTAMLMTVSYFLLVLGFAAWLYGTYQAQRWPLMAVILLVVGGWWIFIQGQVAPPPVKPSGLVAKVRAGLKEGRPVFVDFTADWCLNCIAFEKLVLETEPIQNAFKEKNVLFIKADWTHQAPDITAALKKMGRAGVPAYVLFRKRGDYWMADGLTTGGLMAELNKL